MKCNICHWWFLILFSDACDIFYAHYCELISFHDSALSLVAKVCTHFFFFTIIYAWFDFQCMIILISIDFFINCYTSFYLVETHFRDLEGYYGFYCTFPISNLTFELMFDFSYTIFSK